MVGARWWEMMGRLLRSEDQHRRRGRRPRLYRPWLEALERRLAPTVTLSVSNPAPFPKPDTGQIMGMFVVTRSGDLAPAVQVNYATQDGTGLNGAHAGIDYTTTSGTLYFASNQMTATITVPIIGNNVFQADKMFTVSLSNPLPSAAFAPQQAFATGTFPISVAVGDFNGDGKPDLAVANYHFGARSVSVLLNTTPVGATTPSFAPQQTFPTGRQSSSVVVADFNGDGKPDLVVNNQNYGDGTVSVLLNTTPAGATTPSFAFQQTFATGSASTSVAVGDFNGDGKPDLVVGGLHFTVSVLLNTTPTGATTPSFAPRQTFATGGAGTSVAVGDFNGDGKPDLAIANDGSSDTVSVLLNTTPPGATTPSFAPQQTFATGNRPLSVAVGDFNGDGKPDLVVSNSYTSDSVSVLLNTTPAGATTPSFAPHQTFATGSNPASVAVGDFNGDGKPDFAIAITIANGGSSGAVSVLLNTTPTGATTPSFAPRQTFATGGDSMSVAVGDFNGDGKPDLAIANLDDDTISVLLNTRAPITVSSSFSPRQTFVTGHSPRSVAVGDFNGDGKPDLVVASGAGATVSVLLNTTAPGATAPSFAPEQTFFTGSGARAVGVGDFNGDGKLDIATANAYSASSVSVLLNTTSPGSTTLGFTFQRSFATGMNSYSVAVGDLNGDGKPDLIATNLLSDTVSVLLNTTASGATTPSFAPQRTFATGSGPLSVALGDVNGDGKPDLVIANVGSSTVSVLLNTTLSGATTPNFAPQQTFDAGQGPELVAVGDFNGDGKLDVAVTNEYANTVSVLLNTAAAGATILNFAPRHAFTTGSHPLGVVTGDFNGDGQADLVVGNGFSDTASILLNTTIPGTTSPSFTPEQTFTTGSRPYAVAVGDLNGDGKPDLAVVNESTDTVSVLLNTVNPILLGVSQATGTIREDDAPVSISASLGTTPQSAVVNRAFTVPLAVDVRNAAGNLVQGVSVTFTAPGSGPSGRFGGSTTVTVVTNASGRATAPTFTANTIAGTYPVVAQAAGGSNPSTSFGLTNNPGAPAVLTATAGSNQSAMVNTGFTINLLATLTDQYGNRVPGILVTFTAPGSGASASFTGGATGTSNASGQVSKAITANTVAGNYSIMAAASGGSNPTTTFVNLTNTPAAAHHFDVTAPGSVTAGTPFTVTVTARDLYNNVATGYLGISHFTSSDPCEALPNDYAFTITDNGVHTFSNMVTLWRGGNQNVTVRDAMNSTITGGATVNVTPVYVVSNSNDNGPGSLRQAILTANCNPGADTITFAIGTGVQTINLLSPLPAITDPVVIDGSTQPGYAGQPLIELNGASAGANANGLTISAGSSVVKSLVINRFSADGIWLSGSGGDVVQGNYIGTNAMGTAALGNIQAGILISNVGNNIIGGTTTATRNVISGNGGEGIDIVGAGASNNLVQGDYIGTNAAGTAALPNQSDGVLIQDAPNNTIGGTAVGAGNVISGNNRNGVDIRGSSATSNLVAGNSIGTNRDGNAPLANAATGVAIDNAPNNTVGGTDRDPGVCNRTCNVIAGNTQNGVLIINPAATGNMVQGNLIGTNAAGTAPVGNGDGVYVAFGAVGDLIGGTSAGSRNIISGNQREGVHIQNPGGMSAGDLVQGNYIGLDITGTLPLSNVSHGVALLSGWNTIGGSAAGARNVISANGAAGIIMFGNAVGNTVRGNWIGTQADGQSPLGNGLHGVWINGAGGNSIISNTIAFSGGNGVRVDAGTGNAIQGNVMFGDTDLGIHLVNGGNDDQAAPVIARAVADTVATRFKGTLSSTPDTAFTLEFFANRVCHPSGYGEAEIRLGTVMVTTDGEGQAPWSFRLDYPLPVGYFVSATATSAATNDTSEFAACVAVTGLGVRPWGTKSQKLGQDVRFPGQALARADALPSARSRKAFAIVVRADATTLECYKNGPEMTGRRSAPARTGTRGISGHGIPVDGGEGVLEALSGADLDAFFAASICRPSGVGQRGPV